MNNNKCIYINNLDLKQLPKTQTRHSFKLCHLLVEKGNRLVHYSGNHIKYIKYSADSNISTHT